MKEIKLMRDLWKDFQGTHSGCVCTPHGPTACFPGEYLKDDGDLADHLQNKGMNDDSQLIDAVLHGLVLVSASPSNRDSTTGGALRELYEPESQLVEKFRNRHGRAFNDSVAFLERICLGGLE